MFSKFLKYFSVFAVAACFSTVANAIDCPTGQQDYNGVCKYLRTTSTTPAPFVPVVVKNKENIFLYPTVMPAKCATVQADSDCMVAYSYTDTSLPPVISASFTNTAPVAGSTSTSPQWTSTNAVSMSISCSGVASSMAGSIAVQGTPSGITFTSSTAGTETCILSATNPFGISSSASISVIFTPEPLPAEEPAPTISVSRTPLPFIAGQNHSITWSTTNATSVNQVCTSTGTGYTFSGSRPLSGGNTGVANPAWVGYPTHCVWTATGLGGTATAIDDFSTLPASLVQVYRMRTPSGIYYYTYNVSERDALTAAYGWVTEGAVFKIYAGASDIAGLFPAYRFNNDFGGHFWTISESEKATVISSIPQYHYEGIGWYAVGSAISGSIPLYRLYNGNTSTHFYTTSIVERDWIMANLAGWSNDGAAMYVWP